MKGALEIALIGAVAVTLSSCGDFGLRSGASFDPSLDPLDSPGRRKDTGPIDTGPYHTPGSYVQVTDQNAAFYEQYPRGSEQPDRRLVVGTSLKVVGSQGSYVKVETEAGQIGFVPAIMLSERSEGTNLPIVPAVPGGSGETPAAIDPIDPTPVPSPLPAPGT
ncbi:MAG: hypothetical protein GWO24_28300, partial [Akkermansiaceae bacterium]|nr:hypothetical protein [Akkermansiaceae bacterium]